MDYNQLQEGTTVYLPVFIRERCCSWVTATPRKATAS